MGGSSEAGNGLADGTTVGLVRFIDAYFFAYNIVILFFYNHIFVMTEKIIATCDCCRNIHNY